jgi:molybdate-binding protein/transcriptional regulator with XRE-family HTH domain
MDTIMSYTDTIMPQPSNRVRQQRLSKGWSQSELARRAGISRAAVSAIEIDRLVPSVAAALALGEAFGCSVEDLFGEKRAASGEPEWAWPPTQAAGRYWHARVGGRRVCFPVEVTPAGVVAHDGVYRDGRFTPRDGANAEETLVLASCDPAAGLLAAEFGRTTGFRLLVLPRSSGQALELLRRGLVHAAGVHFAGTNETDRNARDVRAAVGPGHRLLGVADWEEGLAVDPAAGVSTVGGALRARLRWVGREPGSGARRCLEELRPTRPAPRRLARDHRGVAEAVRSGWADVGVCHRLAAEEAGLRFLPVRQEAYDLCYPAASDSDPRLVALVAFVRSAKCRRLLGDLPGFAVGRTGDLRTAV